MDPEISHLEDLLDLFRKIDALTRCAVGLHEQVDQQMLAARKRETAAIVKIGKRRKPRR